MSEANLNTEIDALLRLLDDPDQTVQKAVRDRLSALGPAVLPALRAARTTADEPLRSLLDTTLHDLHIADIAHTWRALMKLPEPDLETGAFLIARYGYPELDIAPYQKRLDAMAGRIRPRIEGAEGPQRAVILCAFMCEEMGFTGNEQDYYAPHNSYLNWVLDHRRGIPISLSVIFLLLARRLDLPVFGVNMPAHFLVKYLDEEHEVFLDLFNGGGPVTREEATQFLKRASIPPHPSHFEAADTHLILLRMVRNLFSIAHAQRHTRHAADFARLLNSF